MKKLSSAMLVCAGGLLINQAFAGNSYDVRFNNYRDYPVRVVPGHANCTYHLGRFEVTVPSGNASTPGTKKISWETKASGADCNAQHYRANVRVALLKGETTSELCELGLIAKQAGKKNITGRSSCKEAVLDLSDGKAVINFNK